MPDLTPDSLLQALHLDGDTPDGRTLMDRFLGEGGNFGTMRAVWGVLRFADELIDVTNERTANPAQEKVAQALGGRGNSTDYEGAGHMSRGTRNGASLDPR